jgi:hypothetical protein
MVRRVLGPGILVDVAAQLSCLDIADRERKARGSNECKALSPNSKDFMARSYAVIERPTACPDRSASLVIP